MVPFLLVGGSIGLWLIALGALSQYRKDRQGPRRTFAATFDLMQSASDILSRESYTDEGKRLIPLLWAAAALVPICMLAAVLLWT